MSHIYRTSHIESTDIPIPPYTPSHTLLTYLPSYVLSSSLLPSLTFSSFHLRSPHTLLNPPPLTCTPLSLYTFLPPLTSS